MMSFRLADGRRLAVNTPSREALIEAVDARLAAGRGFSAATLNLDHLVKLARSAPFRDAYVASDFVVADGNPVVWLSRLAGRPVALAPGSELIDPLCALAARRGAPVALVGSTEDALRRAADLLSAAHPGLRVALIESPPFGFDPQGAEADALAARVAASGARLCLLAFGAPKQEILAVRAAAAAPACGFVSVGAGLDFIAGAQRRAPPLARRFAMEWLWRLLSQPGRLGRRYLDCALILPRLAVEALRMRAGAEGGT